MAKKSPSIKESQVLHLNNFIEMLAVERSAANNTILSYRKDISDLILFLTSKNNDITKVNHSEIVCYINDLNNQKLANSTIARKISSIRQFFEFMISEKLRPDNPALKIAIPKRNQLLPKSLPENSIEKLLESAEADKSAEGIRNAAMLETLYATGMRISELVTLKIQSLERNLTDNSLLNSMLISGKGGRERIVILSDSAISKLSEYLIIRQHFLESRSYITDWLFPSLTKRGKITYISRQRFGQILKSIALSNGIEPKLISAHKIRHSFASHMLRNGANIRIIQELLGHVSISSTQIYTKVYPSRAAEAVLLNHPLNQD